VKLIMTSYNLVKCDLCGKEKINSFGKIPDALNGVVIDLVQKWMIDESDSETYFQGRFDLCKECQSEIIENVRGVVKSMVYERISDRQKEKLEGTLEGEKDES